MPRLLLFLLIPALSLQQRGDTRRPAVSGTWSDACPCAIPCTCWRDGKASVAQCLNIQMYAMESAENSPSKSAPVIVLVGLPLAAFQIPQAQKIYVDERIPKQASERMVGLLRRAYGIAQLEVQEVKMVTEISRRRHIVRIPGLLRYEVELGTRPISDDVAGYLYDWLHDPAQWRTVNVEYSGTDGKIAFAGTNAISASFRIDEN